MRALLVVNPRATATTASTRNVLISALASDLKLDVAETRHRGHATELARQAALDGFELVVVLGGDGTINEVVNGLLADGPGPDVPALAVVSGGSTNVFPRALGLPREPVEATAVLLDAVRAGRRRVVGLGTADERYFTFCAGLGLDGEVVRMVEARRRRGRRSTSALYVRTAVEHFFTATDRRHPAIVLERPGADPACGLYLGIVANTAPWTYLGARPVNPCPRASFDLGLDLFALRRLRVVSTLRHVRQILSTGGRPPRGRDVVVLHDVTGFTLRSQRPLALQVDGDYVGEREVVTFRSRPRALRVVV
jgi:diacylglycerol kinase family enzyme